MFGLTLGEIGVILLVLFLAAAFDFWRGKLGKNITPKRLAIYGALILLSAVFFWNTIESRPFIPAARVPSNPVNR